MKNIIKSLAAGLLVFTLIYLVGSFIAADFNITHWAQEGRIMCGVFGGLISLTVMATAMDIYNKD